MSVRRWTQHRTHAVPASVSWTDRIVALRLDVSASNRRAAARDQDRSQKYAQARARFYDRQMREHALALQAPQHMDATA